MGEGRRAVEGEVLRLPRWGAIGGPKYRPTCAKPLRSWPHWLENFTKPTAPPPDALLLLLPSPLVRSSARHTDSPTDLFVFPSIAAMLSRHLARSLRTVRIPTAASTPLRAACLQQTRSFAKKSPAVPRVVRQAQERAAKAAQQQAEGQSPVTPPPPPPPPSSSAPPTETHPAEAEPIIPTPANAEPLSQTESTAATEAAESATSEAAESGEHAARSKAGGGGKGGGDIPKSAYISSSDRRRQRNIRYMGLFSLASLVGFIAYMGRPFEPIERKLHPEIDADSWDPVVFLRRINARRKDILDFYNEPPFDKLLPDMVPEYGRPYTLVLSLEDLMIHSEWTREYGWRIAKRPGLDYFLGYLFQYFEIVVFTNQPDAMAAPIIQKVDPSPGFIMYPLFRAHTRYVDGKYVKDLNYLNRDLKKVIMLETNPDAWSANPDNTIKMKPWKGEKNDKELVALIPFLEYIAALNVDDVREVIRDYDGTHIPTEFARREAKLREELRKQLPQKKGKQPPAWLLGLVGMKPKPEREEEDVKTFMDMVRERGQQMYLETQRHLAENKEAMEMEQKLAEKEMAEQMKTSLTKILTEVRAGLAAGAGNADGELLLLGTAEAAWTVGVGGDAGRRVQRRLYSMDEGGLFSAPVIGAGCTRLGGKKFVQYWSGGWLVLNAVSEASMVVIDALS